LEWVKETLNWQSASRTHVGMVRKVNEDALLERPDLGLWAIADGMGGHDAGQFASQLVVSELNQVTRTADDNAVESAVRDRLQAANSALRSASKDVAGQRIMGSTIVVLMALGEQGIGLWAGDSRLYRLRDHNLEQLTRDHSQVQEWIDEAVLSPEQAHRHPSANVITRAVGADDDLQIDKVNFPTQSGDVYLLCSDGLTNSVEEREIVTVLDGADPTDAVRALVHMALLGGARDNVTLIVVTARA
jgi:serine/threonine protein phosphatase PrpC